MPIEILPLPVSEWPAYRQIRLEALHDSPQAFSSTYAGQLARPDSFWQGRLEEAARGEQSWLLFARSGERLVGMIGAFRTEAQADQAEIVSVYVTPEARGQGVASRLMGAILDVLKAKGFRKVTLGVNASQAAALHLYQRSGFSIVRTENVLMGDNVRYAEHLMEKTLGRWPRAQCIVHRGERLLMVKHRHEGVEWWCLPGGGIEPGETPAAAALRELREECGLDGVLIRQTSRLFYAPDDQTYSFLVQIGGQEPRLGADPEFHAGAQILAEVRWLTLTEIPERDRAYLWAAGLLGVPEFLSQVETWGDAISLP